MAGRVTHTCRQMNTRPYCVSFLIDASTVGSEFGIDRSLEVADERQSLRYKLFFSSPRETILIDHLKLGKSGY